MKWKSESKNYLFIGAPTLEGSLRVLQEHPELLDPAGDAAWLVCEVMQQDERARELIRTYRTLLFHCREDERFYAAAQSNLGTAYVDPSTGDREGNLARAIGTNDVCCQLVRDKNVTGPVQAG